MLHGVALTTVGSWLLVYRLLMGTRAKPVVERLTTLCSGVSLALVAPLLSWPPAGFRTFTLCIIGVLLSCCHPAFAALVVAMTLAFGISGFVWNLGLCATAPVAALADFGVSAHALLCAVLVLLFIILFVFIPGIAGPETLIFFLVPMLGSLLLCLGISELQPSMGGPTASGLLLSAPCAAEEASSWTESPAVRLVGAWLLVAMCGTLLQFVLVRRMRLGAEEEEEGERKRSGPGGDLVQSLLPGSQQEEGGGANIPRPSDKNDRYSLISKAIFMDESADLSHLTENEQKIVKICREDEFERDRLLWGGGLI